MGIVQAFISREAELERENAHLRDLLKEAGESAERGALLLALNDDEHVRVQQRLVSVTERQSFHMAELGHRLRNTISLVQAIAHQSLRSAASLDAARDALDLRLAALWRVHEALLADDWTSASVAAVVEGVTSLHSGGAESFVLLGDEGVQLDAQAALSLGLALHELATNAAKYGALSRDTGRVSVTWRTVRGESGGEILLLDWRETGGPPVAEPTRRGFGTRLISGGIGRELDGEVVMDFDPAGLRCAIRVPLPAPERAN